MAAAEASEPWALSLVWSNKARKRSNCTQNMITVRLEVKDGNVKNAMVEVLSSLSGFLILQEPEDQTPCNLMIMEVEDNFEKEFERASNFQTSGIAGEVFLTSPTTNPDILIAALKMGVRGFFSQPINKGDVTNSLLKFKKQRETSKKPEPAAKRGKIINVLGCKGGVGTTTIAVNLAVNLAKLEAAPSVAIIDMNRIFGEVAQFLSIEQSYDWEEIASNISRLDSTLLKSILRKHSSGVYVLPPPVKISEDYTPNAAFLEKLLELMRMMFDFIVIDSGQFIDAGSKLIMRLTDKVIFVLILSLPCIINYKRIKNILSDIDSLYEQNGEIIVSRYEDDTLISLKDLETTLDKKIFCVIPNKYKLVSSAVNQGKPIDEIDPRAPISKSFKRLASVIAGAPETEGKQVKRSLFRFK